MLVEYNNIYTTLILCIWGQKYAIVIMISPCIPAGNKGEPGAYGATAP